MSLVETLNAPQQPTTTQASIHGRLDAAQVNIRHALRAVTLHEGLLLDCATSDDLWPLLQRANNSLDAERRERERLADLNAKAEAWNAEELRLFAYMAELPKQKLVEMREPATMLLLGTGLAAFITSVHHRRHDSKNDEG